MKILTKLALTTLLYSMLLIILVQFLLIVGTIQELRGEESDVWNQQGKTVWEQDTGNIRYEVETYDWDPYDRGRDHDCDSQPVEDSPVAEEIRKENYKDWLRSYDVEEGLLVW